MANDTFSEDGTKPKFAKMWREDLASPEVLGLNSTQFRVLVILRAFVFTDSGYGVCHELIHDFTGYDRRTIQRALAALGKAGLLSKQVDKDGRTSRRGNHWTLHEPPTVTDARSEGRVPAQYPQGRREHRPAWRHDRRPEASEEPPIEGVADAAQQGEKENQGDVTQGKESAAADNSADKPKGTGLWPGLLGKVTKEIERDVLRVIAEWVVVTREPTPQDVQRRLQALVREFRQEHSKQMVTDRIAASGVYDLDSLGRGIPGLIHAVRSLWSRAANAGLREAERLINVEIGQTVSGDSNSLMVALRRLGQPED